MRGIRYGGFGTNASFACFPNADPERLDDNPAIFLGIRTLT